MLKKEVYALVIPRWVPMRALVALMLFTACWTTYVCRLQMPILVVPMIRGSGGAGGQPGSARCGRPYGFDDVASKERSLLADALLEAGKFGRGVADGLQMQARLSGSGGGGGGGSGGGVGGSAASYRSVAVDEDDGRAGLHHHQGYYVVHRRERRQDEVAEEPDGGDLVKRGMFEVFTNRPYDWSPDIRGQLLAGYAYGNVIGNLLGGVLSIKYGPRLVVFWTSIISALISFATPLISNVHWAALLASRALIGMAGGTIFPACHTMVAKWAPPDEKARFVWSLLGGTFGTVFAYPMVAGIAEHINWEAAWYIPSLLMVVWIVFWMILAYDSPAEHPGITDQEKNYIITAQAGTVSSAKPSLKETPFKAIFTSVPFLSLVVCHFGNLYLLFFYQNAMMIYLTQVLGFQLTKGGMMAAMPWLGRMVFGYISSWMADVVNKHNLLSTTALRKSATVFSHFLPGMCLLTVGYVGCDLVLANTFLILALAFNGAASIANLSNNQDLAPNYAGFLYSIMNTVGTVAGMIIPVMVEEIAGKYGNPVEKWQTLFQINAAVSVVCMVTFIVGGSGKIQSWNDGK